MTIRNLVTNPRFAVDTSGWSKLGASLTRITHAGSPYGDHWGNLVLDGTRNPLVYTSALTPLENGRLFTSSVFVQRASLLPAGTSAAAILLWYTPDGTNFLRTSGNLVTLPSGSGVIVSVTGEPPAGAVGVRFAFQLTPPTGTTFAANQQALFTGAMLNPGSLTNYADGDSYGWEWDGAPHSSTSRTTRAHDSNYRFWVQALWRGDTLVAVPKLISGYQFAREGQSVFYPTSRYLRNQYQPRTAARQHGRIDLVFAGGFAEAEAKAAYDSWSTGQLHHFTSNAPTGTTNIIGDFALDGKVSIELLEDRLSWLVSAEVTSP